jgi:hypothetical protein
VASGTPNRPVWGGFGHPMALGGDRPPKKKKNHWPEGVVRVAGYLLFFIILIFIYFLNIN